ncbi:MAG TPA: DegT/DnrJ/EryC1/StrS family aminotransferase [Candidatus Kapabacteria bacterium]|nr:DegT/DnrJ/EryC1/StrS family aminotransferase [Candidatus Kapabacteria bacterium]
MKKNKPINLFFPAFRIKETLAEIEECLENGWTGLGYKTIEFEEAWKKYTNLPHAHFLNSATAGLHLALRLFKEKGRWKEGDEIISTPLTFVSTNHVILHEKLRPVFADVDEHLCLDPDSVREKITSKTKAVIFVGLGGNTGRLEEVASICRERGLKLILDAAHMAGTRLHGKHIGGDADVAVFSFHAVKNLPTADSGMVCFRETKFDEEVRKWTWLGIDKDTYSRTHASGAYKWYYDVVHEGFKYHGNSVMAAMGLVALKYLDEDNNYRNKIANLYDKRLKKEPGVEIIPTAPDCDSSRHLYQIQTDNRDKVILALNKANIFPGIHYKDNTSYKMYSKQAGRCPRALQASRRVISLPNHIKLTFEDVQRVSDALIANISHKKKI